MNGHSDDFETAFDPTDDERRRAQEEDMWLAYEADCAERRAALARVTAPDGRTRNPLTGHFTGGDRGDR